MIKALVAVVLLLATNLSTYVFLNSKNETMSGVVNRLQEEGRNASASVSAEIQSLHQEKETLTGKIVELKGKLSEKDSAIKSLDTKLTTQTKENTAKIENQSNCDKANELSRIPADMVFHNSGCKNTWNLISSSTQQAIEYLQGFLDNYRKTGSTYWKNVPDVCLQDAETNLPILEKRYADYQVYKGKCQP